MNIIETVKQQLKEQCRGKTMLRRDNSHKGLAERGILTYKAYYSTPIDAKIISEIITKNGLFHSGRVIVGGEYGFCISFQMPKE